MSPGGESRERPLHERDPAAWEVHLAEGNRTQPHKRVAAQVIIQDSRGYLLLVDPSYKPDWDVPGGMAEANEPPAQTAAHELHEELGLYLKVQRLLCVDWVAPHCPWDDLLTVVFDGGVLSPGRAEVLRPIDIELGRVAFCTYAQAEQLLRDYVWRRTQAALIAIQTGRPVYMYNGHRIADV